jgi:ABC-type sulfate transport system permease component
LAAYGVTRAARITAGISMAVWFAAILFGRVIAYVMDHAILHGGG